MPYRADKCPTRDQEGKPTSGTPQSWGGQYKWSEVAGHTIGVATYYMQDWWLLNTLLLAQLVGKLYDNGVCVKSNPRIYTGSGTGVELAGRAVLDKTGRYIYTGNLMKINQMRPAILCLTSSRGYASLTLHFAGRCGRASSRDTPIRRSHGLSSMGLRRDFGSATTIHKHGGAAVGIWSGFPQARKKL